MRSKENKKSIFFRQELLEDAIRNNRSFSTWDGATVVAWLEVCI